MYLFNSLQFHEKFFIGNINEDLTFNYDNRTEIFGGCAVTFQNEFWYFGGDEDRSKRQVIFLKTIMNLIIIFEGK